MMASGEDVKLEEEEEAEEEAEEEEAKGWSVERGVWVRRMA
jgi:hypothetical protein